MFLDGKLKVRKKGSDSEKNSPVYGEAPAQSVSTEGDKHIIL